ncbi:MAG: Si-specific NAD(P)(+) transhydrogenase [Deltaproteobacteria bacterium]|nr:Si-specific NAD(P)(+) transhydrogenase [Deltaproteobacteria bacterium]
MEPAESFDVVIIGSGPSGQKAAIQARKAGQKTAVIEREAGVGGACVHQGTIPSKTLRETAVQMVRLRRGADVFNATIGAGTEINRLLTRLDRVVNAHVTYMHDQLVRNGVVVMKGRARFASPTTIDVEAVTGEVKRLHAKLVVIATGSRPRNPPEINVDHENVLDSDSILSLAYLPESMVVLGAGVIASEYASVFALLGVKVTMVDKTDRPLKFLDPDLTTRFLRELERNDGRFIGGCSASAVSFDGVAHVQTHLTNGETLTSEKVLVALGREANLEGLELSAAGLVPTARGLLQVDAHCRTAVPHIYAVGDVIGPPSLASASMEQGRRAICHALGLPPSASADLIPTGVYTVPEISSVGLSAEEAQRRGQKVIVGRASFDQVARGQISGIDDGLLKLVADEHGKKLLGVQIVGDGSTDLVHVGMMALLAGQDVDVFVENIFNFPTLAEAYRVAAFDVIEQRSRLPQP